MVLKNINIIATIGDHRYSEEYIKSLIKSGVDCFRLNTSWQVPNITEKIIVMIRTVSPNVPIILDTEGPELRTEEIKTELDLNLNDVLRVSFFKNNSADIYILSESIFPIIKLGHKLFFCDGKIEGEVINLSNNVLDLQITLPGRLKGKRRVNIPEIMNNKPLLCQKDLDYITLAKKYNIEYFAFSFVRNKSELLNVQKLLLENNCNSKIISKIEDKESIVNLEEIVKNSDAIMIGRGDLFVELPILDFPKLQNDIILECKKQNKEIIVATHVLGTMRDNPKPICSEINDIYNFLNLGITCFMLSSETSTGQYPLESVKLLKNLIYKYS